MNRHHEELIEIGNSILNQSRTELYLDLRFMAQALGSLNYEMDLSTRRIGTDGGSIRYNPAYLTQLYMREPEMINRTYMHLLLHCLFRHVFKSRDREDLDLWDLCCDIATEYVMDSMDYPSIRRIMTDRRLQWYEQWENDLGTITAERLYQHFLTRKRYYYEEESMRQEFSMDDHSFWDRLSDRPREDRKPPQDAPDSAPPEADSDDRNPKDPAKEQQKEAAPLAAMDDLEDSWKEKARQIESELEDRGNEAGEETGCLYRMIDITCGKKRDYREYLKHFTVVREETRIDTDSFDFGYYNYGMQIYGNMPLIEENEFREASKIEELVIAIDTSASCQKKLVRRFLEDTWGILTDAEHFFGRVNIHIIECDNAVQRDLVIHSTEEMGNYIHGFEAAGGYGTDFRPVFERVKELRESGQLRHLKGLMYFTDGFGPYPAHATPYETAFVYPDRDHAGDREAPPWAIRLYMSEQKEIR